MEMQFDKIPVSYLQKLAGQTKSQEQTLEVRLPEDLPDIGRVLGAWGQVVVRGKEWNGDHMAVSSGVMAWVLYTPEDGEGVHSVEAWLPFAMKWDLPESRHDGKIFTSCLLKSVDARSISARKLMVRATVSALGEGWLPTQAEYAVAPGIPEDVELLTNIYPVMLPKETGEKAFVLEEQIHLPAGAKLEKLMRVSGWLAQCRVRFSRILPGFSSKMVCMPALSSSVTNSAQLSLPKTTTAVFSVPPFCRARLRFTPFPPASREVTAARFS